MTEKELNELWVLSVSNSPLLSVNMRRLIEEYKKLKQQLREIELEGDRLAEAELRSEYYEALANVVTGKVLFDAEIELANGSTIKVKDLRADDFRVNPQYEKCILHIVPVSERILSSSPLQGIKR